MKIGFIGLGNMGKPMAKRLIDAGFSLVVFDVDSNALDSFKELNSQIASSVQEVGYLCDIIITMLPNSEIVEEVLVNEDDGLIKSLRKGSILIDMGSSIPSSTRKIAFILEKESVYMIDAPVSGGVKKAIEGSLTIMVGGEKKIFKQVEHILQELGKNISLVGSIGSGHTMKALNNLLSASHFLATTEVLIIGAKAGLRPKEMLEVINSSTGRNLSSEYKFPSFIINRNFSSDFSMDLLTKDIGVALDISRDLNVSTFLSNNVHQVWDLANKLSNGKYDHTELVKFFEEWNEIKLMEKKDEEEERICN